MAVGYWSSGACCLCASWFLRPYGLALRDGPSHSAANTLHFTGLAVGCWSSGAGCLCPPWFHGLPQALGLETDLGCTDRNNLLQKAIRLYLANHYAMDASQMEARSRRRRRFSSHAREHGWVSYGSLLGRGSDVSAARRVYTFRRFER